MSEYIHQWFTVIDEMKNENTYKLAWGKALVEQCLMHELNENGLLLSFDEISESVLKYFWNQTYFFKLYQGPAKTKPILQQITEDMIDTYQQISNSTLPVWFDKAKASLCENSNDYTLFIRKISQTLTKDVSHRFPIVGVETLPLYQLNLKQRQVYFTKQQHQDIKTYAFVLSQLLNYRWAQLLEKFNQSPKITLKVKGSSDEQIRRQSLKKFRDILVKQFEDGQVIDFYTGENLALKDISVDHVIPWSFMYSDDLWNLVLTSRSNNSRKSNRTLHKDYIVRLKKRNMDLLSVAEGAIKRELQEAVDHNYEEKFFYQFKL
jgi:hypothetical protein